MGGLSPSIAQYFLPLLSGVHCVNSPSLFIHSSVDRHLDCFQFGVIMNKTVKNILVAGSCGLVFSFLLDKYPGVELLGHREDVSLTVFFFGGGGFYFVFSNCQMGRLNHHTFEM